MDQDTEHLDAPKKFKSVEEVVQDHKKKDEGHLVAIEVTHDGPVPYYQIDGKHVPMPPKIPKYKDGMFPKKFFKEATQKGFMLIVALIEEMRNMPDRDVPLTEFELLTHYDFTSKQLKALRKYDAIGFWKAEMKDPAQRDISGKAKVVREEMTVYLTPTGKAYLKYLDSKENDEKQQPVDKG